MLAARICVAVCALAHLCSGYVVKRGRTCYLYAESAYGSKDDSSSIIEAFDRCGQNGNIVFVNNEFNINRIMNTTGLRNCNIYIKGKLLWSNDVDYWLANSINVDYQEQSTAWLLGGENVSLYGEGGILDGNGQTWYTQNRNGSNEPGRPITMTFYQSTNLLVKDLTIVQPQFWATFVSHSANVTMTNIYVNATSNDEWSTTNTDGTNTWNSRDILLENWTVQNGDDCIAAKGNTTNLHARNITCYHSNGITIGSVGQYPDRPDFVEDVVFEDVQLINSRNAAYIKTWQGVSNATEGIPQGGGTGEIRNVTFRNFSLTNVGLPIQLTQCVYHQADDPNSCETSKMYISQVTWENFSGTSEYNIAASLHCAGELPCTDVFFKDMDIVSVNSTLGLPLYGVVEQDEVFLCANIANQNTTSGIPCNGYAPGNFTQHPSQNVNRTAALETQGTQYRTKKSVLRPVEKAGSLFYNMLVWTRPA